MMPIHNGTDNFRCHLPIKVYNEYNTINFCERFNITCRFMFVHMYNNFSQRFMFTEAILSYFVGGYSRFTLTFTRCSRFTVIINYEVYINSNDIHRSRFTDHLSFSSMFTVNVTNHSDQMNYFNLLIKVKLLYFFEVYI